MKQTLKRLTSLLSAVLLIGLTACNLTTPDESSSTHQHALVKVDGSNATCTEEGQKSHYVCTTCEKRFSDRYGDNEISIEETVIAAKGHHPVKQKATAVSCTSSGNIEHYKCDNCNKYFEDAQATVEISKDSITIPCSGHDYSVRNEDSLSYWFTCSKCEEVKPDSRQSKDPDFTLPDLSTIDTLEKRLGVGQRYFFYIDSDEKYTAYSWDTNVAKIETYFADGQSFGSDYYIYGVKGGETIISVVGESGKTLYNHKVIIVEDEPVYLGKGNLVKSIDVKNADATVYYDDTLVTYTVKTAATVDELVFSQVTPSPEQDGLLGYDYDSLIELDNKTSDGLMELDTLTVTSNTLTDTFVNKEHGVRYKATRKLDGDEATWIVQWDLGATAVKYVRITAFDNLANEKQTNYAHLNITYPQFGGTDNDFLSLFDLFIKSNSTSAILFESTKEYDEVYHGAEFFWKQLDAFNNAPSFAFEERFTNTTLFGGNSINHIMPYGISTSLMLSNMHTIEELLNGKNVLCQRNVFEKAVMAFYYPISDELRAVWAYQHNYTIDKEKFPYAYDILQKASAILDEIIQDDMTDFQKEKAIYTWLYEWGNAFNTGKMQLVTPPEGLSQELIVKSSYGLFNKYGGDCSAYSGAFYTLCNMAGLQCVTVDLSTEGGGAKEELNPDHRANVVKLDNEYYFVEAFWSWQKTSDEEGTYRFLNFSTTTASTYYAWNIVQNGGPGEFNYTSYLVDEQTGELLNKS